MAGEIAAGPLSQPVAAGPAAAETAEPSATGRRVIGRTRKRSLASRLARAGVRKVLGRAVMRRSRRYRSRRRQRRRRLSALVLGALGLVGLGLVVYGSFLLLFGPGSEQGRKSYADLDPEFRRLFSPSPLEELNYLPDHTANLHSLRVEPMRVSNVYQHLRQVLPGRVQEAEQRLTLGYDFPLAELDRSTQAFGQDGQVRILTTRKVAIARNILARRPVAPSQERKIKGHTVYHFPHGSDFCVAESHVVLYGRFELLCKILERDGPPQLSPGMTTALALADFSQTSVTAVEHGLWGRHTGPLGSLDPAAILTRKPDGTLAVSHVTWGDEIAAIDLVVARDARAAARVRKTAEAQLDERLGEGYPPQNQVWTTLRLAVNGDMLVLTNAVKPKDLPTLDGLLERGLWVPEADWMGEP